MKLLSVAFSSILKASLPTQQNFMTSRTIQQVVPAKPNGSISRLIGTVDVDGAGTLHALPQVDPFMLLDQASITKTDMPPFGVHPHRGHSVVTVLMKGNEKSWDSFGRKDIPFRAPASYYVDAGTGCFHDERSVIQDEADPKQRIGLLQLWMSVKEEDRKRPPRVQCDMGLPVKDCLHQDKVVGQARYYVGGGAKIETLHPITVVHIRQQANTIYQFPMDPSHGGFVINLNGSDMVDDPAPERDAASFGGTKPSHTNDVLVLNNNEEASYLEIQTPPKAAADYMICVGERIKEPWAKKLVANGAVIAATEEEARTLAKEVEKYAAAGKADGGRGSFAPFGV